MARRKNTLSQSLDIDGSQTLDSSKDLTDELNQFGAIVAGQTGSAASITGISGSDVTITGLSGMTSSSVGRCITVEGAGTAANNGTFLIKELLSPTSVIYNNSSGVAPDANNGSISWTEREPYSLEDDLNFVRTDRAAIKGVGFEDPVPTYVRPSNTLTDISANLANIAGKTLDAHAWIEPRYQESISVSVNSTFVTISDIGNLQHATSTDLLGVPIIDGYDIGNERAAFVAIVDAELDGYGDGASIYVLSGANIGERIIGLTRAGASTSPDSVEIAFYSMSVDDWALANLTPYTWESGQAGTINVCYPYRQRLDRFSETAIRESLIKGSLSDRYGSGGGGANGINEQEHKALRHLIHFIDCGPADGFASGTFYEILPVDTPFPTSYTWYESAAKTNKIVELTVTRGSIQEPLVEVWRMYDTDGSTVLATVTDTISYNGAFETSRTRAIS